MYNIKLITYPDHTQRLYFYEKPILEGFDRRFVESPDPETMVNPFDGCTAVVVDEFPEPVIRSDFEVQKSINNSVSRTRQIVYNYSLSNDWDWFVTLTFDPKNPNVDRYDYDSCCYAMKKFLVSLRRWCPDVHYLFVAEKHKDGAFHFHGLLGNAFGLPVTSSGVFQNGNEVFNIKGYKYGFSTATRVKSSRKAGSYLAKYISKDLCAVSKGRKRYWASRNLQLPEKEVTVVDFEEAKQLILDNLFDSALYYKHGSTYDGHGVHFFEFPADSGLDLSVAIRRWSIYDYSDV